MFVWSAFVPSVKGQMSVNRNKLRDATVDGWVETNPSNICIFPTDIRIA